MAAQNMNRHRGSIDTATSGHHSRPQERPPISQRRAGSVSSGKQPISNEKPAPSCVAPTLEQIKILSKQWQASHAASAGAPATGAAASAVAAKQLSVDEEHLEA